jgi:outer membrane lipoprotein carrier protein
MKRTVSLFVVLLLLFPVVNSMAGDARKIIEKVQSRYEGITDARIEFTQSVRFRVSRAEQSIAGTLLFKKPNRYRIETEERTVVTDGVTSWSWNPGNRQMVIDNYREETHSLSPEQLLVSYPKDYFSTLVGEEMVGSVSTHVLRLTPKDDTSFATAMKIWVGKDWLIRKVEITDVNGAVTTYRIESIEVDTKLPDERFTFKAPAGAEIIDLR